MDRQRQPDTEDDMKRRGIVYNSPVVLTFSLLSLAVLLISQATGGALMNRYFTLYRSSWSDPLTYLRLFTHVLGHASGEHYSGNIMLLLLTGPMLEEKYGSRRLLLVMLCTALTTGILHLFLFPQYGVLGASGIVFAFILLSSITGSRSGQIPLTLIVVAVLYLGGEVLDAALGTNQEASQFAHIIGGVVGAASGYLFLPRRAE